MERYLYLRLQSITPGRIWLRMLEALFIEHPTFWKYTAGVQEKP